MTKGRKRKSGIARTASGRPSRAASAYQENIEPILTRMRLFGLTEKDARDQKAATFIGRLCLTKAINQEQYDAALEYLRTYENYQRALKSPDALRSSNSGGASSESAEYDRWCRSAIDKWDSLTAAIRDVQCLHANRGSNIHAALDYIVGRDEELWHLVGDARLGLNAAAHHFGLLGKGKKRAIAA